MFALRNLRASLQLLEDVDALQQVLLQFSLHSASFRHFLESCELFGVGLLVLALTKCDELLLLFGAFLGVGNAALPLEALHMLLQVVVRSPTVVVLRSAVFPVLNGWVALDTMLAAEILFLGTVHVNHVHRGALEFS